MTTDFNGSQAFTSILTPVGAVTYGLSPFRASVLVLMDTELEMFGTRSSFIGGSGGSGACTDSCACTNAEVKAGAGVGAGGAPCEVCEVDV